MLYEDQPLALVVLVVAVVEGWLRVRQPLFRATSRLGATVRLRVVRRDGRRPWSQDHGSAL